MHSCSSQKFTLIKMVTRVHATESLLLRRSQPPVRHEASATLHLSTFMSKTLSLRKLHYLKSSWSNLQPQKLYPSRAICYPRLPIPLQKSPATVTEMSACSYTSPLSPTFILCNVSQCGQLWTVMRFPE